MEEAMVLPREGEDEISTIDFFSNCVRINKPCILKDISRQWAAYDLWNGKTSSKKNSTSTENYFNSTLFGPDQKVLTYVLPDERMAPQMRHDLFSFPRFHEKEMTYKEFLDKFYKESKSGQIVLKDGRNSTGLIEKILMNITLPDFYHDVAEIEGIELLQGGFLIDKPKYEKKE